ncbi:MAG: hypothetical protein ACRD3P_15035 [Terriglobales bacterium]
MPDEDEIPAEPPQPEEKTSPMFDVHPLHKRIHGWRDFLSYETAKQYAEIYDLQDKIEAAEN